MLSRAIVLVLVLAMSAPAAPAPLARRERDTAEQRSWSKPVNGLRARLVAPKGRYRLGDTVRLVLKIQNVSGGTLTIDEPHLSRYINSPGSRQLGWAVTAEAVGQGDRLRREIQVLIASLERRADVVSLTAGEVLRIEIDATGDVREVKDRLEQDRGEPRRADLRFSDVRRAGTYLLRVTFTDRQREGRTLTSPPVRIEFEK